MTAAPPPDPELWTSVLVAAVASYLLVWLLGAAAASPREAAVLAVLLGLVAEVLPWTPFGSVLDHLRDGGAAVGVMLLRASALCSVGYGLAAAALLPPAADGGVLP